MLQNLHNIYGRGLIYYSPKVDLIVERKRKRIIVRKNPICEVYITLWWIEGNLLIMTSMIYLWNEWDENHMLNEGDEKVWCPWDENDN